MASPASIESERIALVPSRPPPIRLARSLAQANAGELFVFDGFGELVPAWRRRLSWAWWVAASLVWSLCWCVALGAWISPWVGGASAVVVVAWHARRLRQHRALAAAAALVAADRREPAYAAYLALERKGLPEAAQRTVGAVLASLEVRLGRLEAALARSERVLAEVRHSTQQGSGIARWRAAGVRVLVLARLGRLDDARRQRDELAGRARSASFQLALQNMSLVIAFAAGTPDELPDADTLHTWAREALLRTLFGETLVLLAWAFHRRGDDDMARHLLGEAGWRLTYAPRAESVWPELQAWVAERRAAWAPGA